MTDKEIKKLIYVTKAAYPTIYNKYSEADLENLLIAWRMCLGDCSYEDASKGLMLYMRNDTKGFPPAAGQIIEQIQKLNAQKQLLPSEAWSIVRKAISRGYYYSEEEYAKMPPAIQKAIGSAQYLKDCAIDTGFNEGVARGQFEKNYAIILEREKYQAKLPESLRIGVTNTLAIERGSDDE